MNILPICITGESTLHQAAAPIDFFDSELRGLVADMIEAVHVAPGVGLTTPQVNISSQVFVWRYGGAGSFNTQYRDAPQLDESPARGFNMVLHGVVVDPTLDLIWDTEGAGAILLEGPDVVLESEDCLSVPGYKYPLKRVLGAILHGYDMDGNAIKVRAHEWLAHIFQHEYDHLQGTLYVDRLAQPCAARAQQTITERG